jgi:hypothetical protein
MRCMLCNTVVCAMLAIGCSEIGSILYFAEIAGGKPQFPSTYIYQGRCDS